MDNKDFAEFLKRFKQQGISNKDIAEYFGYSSVSISNFARGEAALPKALIRACQAINHLESIGINQLNKIKQ